MRSNEYWENLQIKSEEIWSEASVRKPAAHSYGFCAYGDAPPAIGGGMKALFFFDSLKEMSEAIRKHGIFINLPRSDLNLDEVEATLSDLDINLQAIEDTINRLNKTLRHATQFIWIGSFASLLDGSNAFALELREVFRERYDEDDRHRSSLPIEENELEEFNLFISEYSLF